MSVDGYAVECFSDAPMRVRAWFERIEDAVAFAATLPDAFVQRTARIEASELADAIGRAEAAEKEADEEVQKREAVEDDLDCAEQDGHRWEVQAIAMAKAIEEVQERLRKAMDER